MELTVRGSGRVYNLHDGGANGQPLGPAIAALRLEPLAVWIDPALDPVRRERAALVIGAVLIPGAAAPKLVTREMLKDMQKGAVLVDVAIDQGGCFETSKATTHDDPIYIVDDVVHYCVANMPGAVARTSTIALGNATMPFALAIANKGWKQACIDDPHLAEGLNVHAGQLTYFAVGQALGIDVVSPKLVLK